MRYNYLWNYTSSTTFANIYQFNGNSIYDPDAQIGGQQPLGYDQWQAFYSRFYVAGCKVTARVINLSTTDPVRITLVASNYTPDMATTDVSTLPYSVSKLIGTRDGYGVGKLSLYMTTQKITGRRGTEYEANYTGIMSPGGNPVLMWLMNVIAENFNGSPVLNYSIQIRLVYYVKLMQRLVLTKS